MNFSDFNILGVYVAPFVPMLAVAGLVTLLFVRLADRLGLTRYVWHPALFNTAIYVVVLSLVVMSVGMLKLGGQV